jgi:hypothetical protein
MMSNPFALEAMSKSAEFTPCYHGLAPYHDLQCGHRVKADHDRHEYCGTNCEKPGSASPFLCLDCLTKEICLEVSEVPVWTAYETLLTSYFKFRSILKA